MPLLQKKMMIGSAGLFGGEGGRPCRGALPEPAAAKSLWPERCLSPPNNLTELLHGIKIFLKNLKKRLAY